jgi:DNA excision repair protein ERCC-4
MQKTDKRSSVPLIALDTREQLPYEFPGWPCVRKTLPSGDYSLVGHEHSFAIERKSQNDLLGCIFTERFKAELGRLAGYAHAFLAIESSLYRLARCAEKGFYKGNPQAVIGFLQSVPLLYGVQVLFLENRETAQSYVAGLLEKHNRYSLNRLRKDASQ